MSKVIFPKYGDRVANAYFTWFTTTRADGMPQPTPVWFTWDGDTFLIYSKPTAQKVKNIHQNPHVSLNFGFDDEGEKFVVVMGDAKFDPGAPLAHQVPAYAAKYKQGFVDIGMTAETMAQAYSTAIRVTPIKVREE